MTHLVELGLHGAAMGEMDGGADVVAVAQMGEEGDDTALRVPRSMLTRIIQARLEEMFNGYLHHPDLLPDAFFARAANIGLPVTVGDYLAGMTDRFALREHARLFARG